MSELIRPSGQEFNKPTELSPTPGVVDALRGKIAEPIQTISQKPGEEGTFTRVRLLLSGSGQFGLKDRKDNKEWSGIFNHSILSARYSVHFAEKMAKAGYETHPQTILDAMIVSHAGRRSWDEAGWYPQAAPDAREKRSISNETLGLQLIQGKVPQDAFALVAALAHNLEGFDLDPAMYDSWDYKLTSYVDHRTTQSYEPLNTRMGNFLIANFFDKDQVTPEVKERVYEGIEEIVARQRDSLLNKPGVEPMTLDEADQIAESLGANEGSTRLPRKDLIKLILNDAETEAALIKSGVDPDAINDQTVPMPKWEDDIRMQYVGAAGRNIFNYLYRLRLEDQETTLYFSELLAREYPENNWWTEYASRVFREYGKKKLQETQRVKKAETIFPGEYL